MASTRARALLVDPHPGMMQSLRNVFAACGITTAHAVRDARDAVRRLRNMRYDVVLVDYDLGPGPDGQQLLEHCRREALLPPTAVFVMVTAERAYDRVMSAAEFAPDDYLVKPFTEDTLRQRLARALQKKRELADLYALRSAGKLDELVLACDRAGAGDSPRGVDLARMKADALLDLGRPGEARDVYATVLGSHDLPWAKLGLARAHAAAGEVERARGILAELLADTPEYLAAYDLLTELHERSSNDEDAKTVLRMAIEVSPNSLHRHQAIGEIALRTGDLDTAEAALSTVIRRGRHTFTRSSENHLRLARVLLEREKYDQALETLSDARKSFAGEAATRVGASTLESLVHARAGNPRDSRRALDEALGLAAQTKAALPDEAALELARACYLNRRENEGADLVRTLVSNNHDDADVLDTVRRMFGEIDREEQGESLIERCVADAVRVNNEGVERAKAGDLDGAIELLAAAAANMPGNAHIVMNAAHALIAHMQVNGMQADKMARVEAYLAQVGSRSPGHPKYVQVATLYERLRGSGRAAA